MSDYYCPNCGADLGDQSGFDPDVGVWTCTECGQFLMDDDIADGDDYEGVAWFCDNCNALLNRQSGFSDSYDSWTCTKCGHTNGLSDEDILEDIHKCPNCGSNLKKQWSYSEYSYDHTCSECDAVLHREYSDDEFSVVDDKNKCPNCGANLKEQWSYSEGSYDHTCSECDAVLHREYSDDEFSIVGSDEDNDGEQEDYYDSKEYHHVIDESSLKRLEEELSSFDAFLKKEEQRIMKELSWQNDEEAQRSREDILKKEEGKRLVKEKKIIRRKKFWRTLTRKKQIVGVSSEACRTMKYADVVRLLEKQEFSNISTRFIEDLPINHKELEGIVAKVYINGTDVFSADAQFPFSSKIEIVYHMLRKQNPPMTSRDAKKRIVDDVVRAFSNAGFANIEKVPIPDLKKGWIVKENSVEKVDIDGKSNYRKIDRIRIDTKIIIRYHTFRNK